MNTYELISSLVDSLAWPASTLIAIFILKSPLSKLLSSLSRFKYNELEMDFTEILDEVNESLNESESLNEIEPESIDEIESTNVNVSEQDSNIIKIAKVHPSSAVVMSFNRIEHEINNAVMRLAISPDAPSYNSSIKNIELLEKYGGLDKSTIDSLKELRKLRNVAVHSHPSESNITYNAAMYYYELTEKIISILQSLVRS